MKPWKVLFFALLVYFCGLRAHADVVFVNVNGGTKEIEAVREATEQTGERLYVIPDVPSTSNITLTPDDFAQALLTLANQGVRPRSLIVSGHHTQNEGFFGKNGTFELKLLGHSLENVDAVTLSNGHSFYSNIQSLYLWGCYTGTEHNLSHLTGPNTLFNGVQFIVGFDATAPLSTNSSSGQSLKAFLLKETDFKTATSARMSTLFQGIPFEKESDFILLKDDRSDHRHQSLQ